ncbi:hypothetical protein Atu4670 [Agrobacterium fabrum str. C58]|uniref:Uncharacterized protein n=1 Tax=Agrobacterium fabrum (strain C58 / ATCC 33970) TaxID=176299 RepID=Q8U6Y6_AGRFC|nr:hypothetical protein Atu4670 [Agrobacterium fabrum str. C58]
MPVAGQTARVMNRIAKQESHGTKGSKNKNAREAGVEVFISGDIACIYLPTAARATLVIWLRSIPRSCSSRALMRPSSLMV